MSPRYSAEIRDANPGRLTTRDTKPESEDDDDEGHPHTSPYIFYIHVYIYMYIYIYVSHSGCHMQKSCASLQTSYQLESSDHQFFTISWQLEDCAWLPDSLVLLPAAGNLANRSSLSSVTAVPRSFLTESNYLLTPPSTSNL